MRILTVRNPWAWAIIHSTKTIENHSRNMAGGWRGSVAIHVALRHDWDAKHDPAMRAAMGGWYLNHDDGHYELEPWRMWHGAIIGVVDLTDVHPVANPHFNPICHDLAEGLTAAAIRGGACSPWASTGGQWHMVLANPRPLSEPIPYRGALGLRALDAETTARVEAAMHSCEACPTCGTHGGVQVKCCGCYDGVCCQEVTT